jgi:hypothetical protein
MQLKCIRDGLRYQEAQDGAYEKEWKEFAEKYPEHYEKLKNCDELYYYANAWQKG